MIYTHQLREQRSSIVDWIANDNYTHAITLNTDRELSESRLREIFSTYCYQFDKRVLRKRDMRSVPKALRLRAIVFPENLSTNAHLHGLADFTPALSILGAESHLREEVERIWLKATRGAGSIDLKADPNRRWCRYCTKRFDGTYFFAAEFHPN